MEATWDIQKIVEAFEKKEIPKEPIKISKHETIENVDKFIEGHINYLRHNNGNMAFSPYYTRLQKLYKLLKDK